MTRGQAAMKRIDKKLANVTALAQAYGYKRVELAANPGELGKWYWIKADGFIIGAGNTWTEALNEADAYLGE